MRNFTGIADCFRVHMCERRIGGNLYLLVNDRGREKKLIVVNLERTFGFREIITCFELARARGFIGVGV